MRRPLLTFCLVLVFFAVVMNISTSPYRHPKTGILSPDAMGQVKLVDVKDYEKENPGLGVGIMYRTDTFQANTFVYDLDKGPIPSVATTPIITAQFEKAIGDVCTLERRWMYEDVVVQIPKGSMQAGAFPFLNGKMTYALDDIKRPSQLYLIGYKRQFAWRKVLSRALEYAHQQPESG